MLGDEPAALALLGVVAVLSFALYRGYHVQRLRYSRLELLYQFTRSVDQALQNESVMETVRAEACELLRARSASVVLCQPNAVTWWSAACQGKPVLLARGGESPEHDLLRAEGHVDGLAAPLRDGGEITGVFLVSDRLDDMSTFDRDDLKLFEALAGHASVALTNSALVARVRAAAQETEHLSLHDPLTGLPNRLHFQQRLEQRCSPTGSAAVLLMDLDRFKEVNDTLGHDVGDRLLREVGAAAAPGRARRDRGRPARRRRVRRPARRGRRRTIEGMVAAHHPRHLAAVRPAATSRSTSCASHRHRR